MPYSIPQTDEEQNQFENLPKHLQEAEDMTSLYQVIMDQQSEYTSKKVRLEG